MRDSSETAFLRAIAAGGDDNTARLVYSDWLEENGQAPQAEFLRIQCKLAMGKLDEDARYALRLRERELLNTHRHEWCRSFGLPIEEVVFERGLISQMRLSKWNEGQLLDPDLISQFAPPLVELDLSRLELKDRDLKSFVEKAQLPALRKLILSDNAITDAGAAALATATGLPQLDSIYLFGNTVNDGTPLKRSTQFRLSNLDLGERVDGYCMSVGEAEMARRRYLREHLIPFVTGYFEKYELLQSAMLCVAQYWDDEADDAVHGIIIVSEQFEPVLKGVHYDHMYDDEEAKADPNVPNTVIKGEYGETGSVVSIHSSTHWDDNSGAIPLWAAFTREGGSQESDLAENDTPAAMFYRHGGYEILPMIRPHLNGIRPIWGLPEGA